MTKKTIEEFQLEYESLRPLADRLCESLKFEIGKCIENEGLVLGFPIQSRVKKWESISEKINSKRYNVKKTIKELQDLVGFRIILLFKRDVQTIIELLQKQLEIQKIYNTADKLQIDQFGYSSIHVVAKIPKEWAKVPSFMNLDHLNFEIQIRTISQHIWAESSNVFQYKQNQNVPTNLMRSIGRISALLEVVDLEFDRLLIEREDYESTITKEVKTNKNLDLNVDILRATLDKYLPPENKISNDDYSLLLSDLKFFKIETVDNLVDYINKNLKYSLEKDKEIAQGRLKNFYKIKANLKPHEIDRVKAGVFFTHSGLIRTSFEKAFPTEYKKFFDLKYSKKTD